MAKRQFYWTKHIFLKINHSHSFVFLLSLKWKICTVSLNITDFFVASCNPTNGMFEYNYFNNFIFIFSSYFSELCICRLMSQKQFPVISSAHLELCDLFYFIHSFMLCPSLATLNLYFISQHQIFHSVYAVYEKYISYVKR